jgi:exodeoxyribonuclease V beta subunit
VEGSFSLAGLQRGAWLVELEFFFPLRFITSDILRNCLQKWCGADQAVDLVKLCRELRFRPVQGMVRGFMDMVFQHKQRYYLLDWKSNHLGYRVEDYGRSALKGAMERKLYPLQYLLYTVALNRYLSLRVKGYHYTTHFGGVLYVFLRGVSPERGEEYGIFRDIPPEGMIDDLTECLIQAGG